MSIPNQIENPSTPAEEYYNQVVKIMQDVAADLRENAEDSGIIQQYYEQLGAAEVALSNES